MQTEKSIPFTHASSRKLFLFRMSYAKHWTNPSHVSHRLSVKHIFALRRFRLFGPKLPQTETFAKPPTRKIVSGKVIRNL